MSPAWASYLGEAAEYARASLRAPSGEARDFYRDKAEWALREACARKRAA